LKELSPEQEISVLGFIRAFFRQAVDLLEDPARAPGWVYEDPVVLQVLGQASRLVVRAIEALAAKRPVLKETLERPGLFLDIGSGVGWLAIEAARSWPSFRVVGIDPWEPALSLARQNLAGSDVADRVTFRAEGLESLKESEKYSLVWLASPFIPKAVVEDALPKIQQSLKPGGWFVFGLFNGPPTPLAEALTKLRIVRNGGYPWTVEEATARLRTLGYESIEEFSPGAPILMVVGRKPG
jgi:SAM-dependent methyltransferase